MAGPTSSADLDDLTSGISRYCRERLPEPTRARPAQVRDASAARASWTAMAADLGLGSLLVAEEHGGAGAGLVEAGRVAEVLAAELACVPFLSAGVLAPTLLAHAASVDGEGAQAARGLLASIARDGLVVAVALDADGRGSLRAEPLLGDDGTATARFRHVLDADVADVVVLVGAGGAELVAVQAAHLAVDPRPSFDLTRGLADVRADAAPATVLATGECARSAYRAMLTAGRLALASDSAGGAQAALWEAVAYAKQRVQFGREIGSFQAVKHLLADRYVDAESALSVARLATAAHVGATSEATRLELLAAFYCAEKFAAVAADGIQVHGGMGFTAECRAHLHRRRAESNRHLLGDPARLRAAYVQALVEQEDGR